MEDKFIFYDVDGERFKIRESEMSEFEKDFPTAKVNMSVDGENFPVGINERNEFLKDFEGSTVSYTNFDEPEPQDTKPALAATMYDSDSDKKDDKTTVWESAAKGLGSSLAGYGLDALNILSSNNKYIYPNATNPYRLMQMIKTGKGPEMIETPDYDTMMREQSDPAIKEATEMINLSERWGQEADPTGGKEGFVDLIFKGKIGKALQKGVAVTTQSLPTTISARHPMSLVLNMINMAGRNYAKETLENPDMPKWKRGIWAVGSAAWEQIVEKYVDPFETGGATAEVTEEFAKELLENGVKEAVENIAKKITKRLTKNVAKKSAGEGVEEVVTSIGQDVIGEGLDLIDGETDYGIRAQWEDYKEEHKDATKGDFALDKAKEYFDSFIGGALSGSYMSGPTQIAYEGAMAMQDNDARKKFDDAREYGSTMDYGNIYDSNDDVARATDAVADAMPKVSRDFLDNLSAEQVFSLSRNQNIPAEQRQALSVLANEKAKHEGLNQKLNERLEGIVNANRILIDAVAEDGNIVEATYNGKAVYVKGAHVNNDGTVSLPNGNVGPVIVVDARTGAQHTVNTNEISSAIKRDALEYGNEVAEGLFSMDEQLRETARTTMSPRAKMREVSQYAGKKMNIDLGNGIIEVEVQQILPLSGEVQIKGKKGDLNGNSITRIGIDAFYDSITRDDNGNPMFVEGSEVVEEEPIPTDEPTNEPIELTGDEDFREYAGPILINGVPTEVEVQSQDDATDSVVYTYTDENGNTQRGTTTVKGFAEAIQQAQNYQPAPAPQPEPAPIDEPIDEPIQTPAPVDDIPETPQPIDWDALFEQSPEDYFAEMQKQFGDKTEKRLNALIAATQKKLDALNKANPQTDNEILENEEKKEKLEAKIATLSEMVARLNTPVAEAPVAPETPATEEPVGEAPSATETPEPVVEEPVEQTPPAEPQTPEPAPEPTPEPQPVEQKPVAPHQVDDPIKEAKKKESELLYQLGRAGLSDATKQDLARRAGKTIADMFATREEYEAYEETANDLGEYLPFFEGGVEESFAKRSNIESDSPANDVPLTNEPKGENNGDTGQTEEGRPLDNRGGRTSNEGNQEGDSSDAKGKSERGNKGKGGESTKQVDKYPTRKGNATQKLLIDTFGFESVTIPNTRKSTLNAIYDFMMEMSKMLGISPKSIGQGGWLSVSNLRSNAHFAAVHSIKHGSITGDIKEVSLRFKYDTLTGIAHEWFHSLDYALDYFNTGVKSTTTSEADRSKFSGRKEVWDAINNIVKAINESGHPERMKKLVRNMSDWSYWLSPKEMCARAFEQYILDKFNAAGVEIEGVYDMKSNTNPTPEEMAIIAPAFDNLFKVLHEKEGKTPGTSVLYQIGERVDTNVSQEAYQLATQTVLDMLRANGIGIEEATADMVEKMLWSPELIEKMSQSKSIEEFDAIREKSKEEHGIVAANLSDRILRVTKVPLHNFSGSLTEATEKAKKWALENITTIGEPITIHKGTIDEFTYVINNTSVKEFFEGTAFRESEKYVKAAYLSVIGNINEVISNCIETEVHPDYIDKKDNKRDVNGRISFDVLIHEYRGVVNIAGQPFKIKLIFKETRNTSQDNPIYAYNLETIKLSNVTSEESSKEVAQQTLYAPDSLVSATKLLNGIEKSYDKGKNLLEESYKTSKKIGKYKIIQTTQGTVYGWTDGKKIYLTNAGINPNTPIHEYTHLWAKAMMQKNPKGWQSIKDLLRGTPVWNEVLNDPNYSNIHNNEDLVASEVLSRISGRENAAKLEKMAQQMLDEAKGTARKLEARGLIQRINDALNQFWNWVGVELFGIEKFESVEQITDRVLWDLMNKTDLGELSEGQIEASIIPDGDLKDKLQKEIDNGEYITLYRAVRKINGKYYSPKMSKLGGVGQEIVLGRLEQSDERPDLAYPVQMKDGSTKYKVNLDGSDPSGTGLKSRTTAGVDYNPYIHASDSMMNDQFTAAFAMPEMTVIEVRVPKSELTSGYHAQYAADHVGLTPWKSGTVDLKLPKDEQRNVYLSRYDMPIREVSTEEIADHIAAKLLRNGLSMPYNLVTPQVAEALIRRGVDVSEKPSGNVPAGQSEKFKELKERVLNEMKDNDSDGLLFRSSSGPITPEIDAEYMSAVERGDMETAQRMVIEAARLAMPNTKIVDENGNPIVMYHGSPNKFTTFDIDRFGRSDLGSFGRGFYFTSIESRAKRYGENVVRVFLNVENPINAKENEVLSFVFGSKDKKDVLDRIFDPNDNAMSQEEKEIAATMVNEDIVNESKNYDGVDATVRTAFDEVVVRDSSQIKSAEPVTYDDAGNVIPLSERFNPDKKDIRYRRNGNNDKFVAQFEQKQNNERQELEYSDEFRRLQEESARLSERMVSDKEGVQRATLRGLVGRIGGTLQRELDRATRGRGYKFRTLVNESKGTSFDIIENIDGRLFHDIFSIVRTYLPNGELVDLHDNYDDAICYITSDGLAGFAVTSDGNLISVYSLYGATKKGFLGAIKDLITEAGATRLDGYNSPLQPLAEIYSKVFGWKVASMMDYNMEYDHDNIAENHKMPQVAFMVNTDAEIETKHFNKDQYDEAESYQKEQADINAKVNTQNAAVDYLAGSARNFAIENAVNEEAAKLGVTVTYKTREEMPKGHKNDKGYFNTKTGEIVICTENASSIADAIQTILHEAVAHKGLRQLMGDRFNEFINRVYNSLDAETKAKVDALATANYNGNTAVAMEEYMASLAETTDFANNSVWDKIKSIFENIINSILGRNDIKIGDNELRYILRASYNNMVNPNSMSTIDGWAKDTNMRNELGINEATPELLSRTGIDPTEVSRETAKATYDRVVQDQMQEFQRQFQDAMQPVRIAIDAIQQETGNLPIEDYENFLLVQNQASSRSRVEIDDFARRYYSPIVEAVNSIIDQILESRGYDKKDKKKRAEAYAEIRQYMIAKHGLERNLYYQSHNTRKLNATEKKKANAKAQEEYDAKVDAINNDATLTDAERELQLREALDEFNAAKIEIETREVPDLRDYSGLTALFGLEPKKYKKAEEEAQILIDNFEAQFGTSAEELWKRVNKATDKTLRHSYECGLLSRQQYNDIKAMFNFYIPLRGFDETTAEDVYSYARFEGNRFNPAVQTAKGRTSIADDPLAIIMNMAESEIAQGNKNRAKQALYNFILNRPVTDAEGNQRQNSLMRVESVWYEAVEDAEGNVTYRIATPDYNGGETYEEFEERMNALAEEDKAYKSKKGKVDVGMRFQKQQNRDAHYVYLKVNGVEKAIYINGDPKAAEAINGTYRPKPIYEKGSVRTKSEKINKVIEFAEENLTLSNINRILSSTFTNYSLEFTARNYFRDMIYSHINIDVKEADPAYRKKFRQNWRHNNLRSMMKLLRAYRAGELDGRALTEDEAAFVEFMNAGGQTGYTVINSVENHKRELERAIKNMQKGIEHGGVKDSAVFRATLGGIELLNECSELVTRFAAFKTSRDMGRSVTRAISDAKEVTVNFNTRGAQDGKGWAGMAARYLGWSKFFFNASVQGVQNLKAMRDANKLKFATAVGGVMAFGFTMPIIVTAISALLNGDDDDEDAYWNIPEYDRQNNFCVPVGGGKYVKIPLPIGFREIYAMGDMLAAAMFNKKFTRDVQQVGMDMANKIASVILPVNPLESSVNGLNFWHTFLYTALPSSAQFAVQNATNIDWKGAPLQKEYTYNENDPQWMKAYSSNPDWMVGLSKWCNEHIGAGDMEGMDWSPEKLDNTLSNLFGGIYTVVKKTGKTFSMVWNEENRNLSNVPLAGVALGSGMDDDDRFITDAYYDEKEYYDKRIGFIKRRAEKFGLTLNDVFVDEKGKHHPKMMEVYDNKEFDFMQEWYKGNKELDSLDNKIKRLEKKETLTSDESQKLVTYKAEYETKRREFVLDMLELD